MFFKQALVAATALCAGALAAPTAASSAAFNSSGNLPSLPFALPPNFPIPANPVSFNPALSLVPTHFGLFGYSYDGKIFNQPYYASGEPYNKNLDGFLNRPQDAYMNRSFGSYAFGIGPDQHLFAQNDGRIATTSYNYDGTKIDWVLFESWSDWWSDKNSNSNPDPIPTCAIIPFFDLLVCELDNKPFKFGYCPDGVPEGIGYTAETVVWGTDISPCTEIILNVKDVPKTYGNQFPAQACPAYPDTPGCQSNTAAQ